MKIDIKIIFCPKCNWKIINPNKYDETKKCPKCNTWCFEIFENYFYKGKDLLGQEFGMTDNDETFFSGNNYKESRKLILKAFKLFEKEKQK